MPCRPLTFLGPSFTERGQDRAGSMLTAGTALTRFVQTQLVLTLPQQTQAARGHALLAPGPRALSELS